jgi:hypothetical protein
MIITKLCYIWQNKGVFMQTFEALAYEFGSLASIASKLGVRESAIYAWKARNRVPIKHIRTLVDLSEGRLSKEVLRPDLFQKG